jgi:hypothetical protein
MSARRLLILGSCALACLADVTTEPEPGVGDVEQLDEPATRVEASSRAAATIDSTPGSGEDPAAAVAEPVPLTAKETQNFLSEAEAALAKLGVRKQPIRHLRGPHPPSSGLDDVYREDRVIAYEGKLEEVRAWMGLAKFGAEQAGPTPTRGPLVRYDLCVTRKDERAWLHVIVPRNGLAKTKGHHYKAESRSRWVLLSDHAEPGVDYQLFKRSAAPSLSRQWGRENVIQDLVELARDYNERTGVRLGIGDVSHVTGGKMKDHWTHRVGGDADLYLLDYQNGANDPQLVWHHYRGGKSIWSTQEKGKGDRESSPDGADTPTAKRLRALAELVLEKDDVAYFVHNDPTVLSSFDAEVGERKPGRRYLHVKNKGYWPVHADHVHLRWIEGPLPVGVTPRP